MTTTVDLTLQPEPAEDAFDHPWRTITRWLIVINVLVFVLDYFVIKIPMAYVSDGTSIFAANGKTIELLSQSQRIELITPAQPILAFYGNFSYITALGQLQVWRFVTYQFCHANIEHIFVNMLGLLLAGPLVETRLGRTRYLLFYLACGIAGPVAHIALTYFHFMQTNLFTPLVGASASIYGVLIAAAMIAPNAIVELLFPPIDVKMKTLALGARSALSTCRRY